jgi:hypothetical protein
MDYQKLLLAAAVRDLAGGIKARESGKLWRSLEGDPDRNQKRDNWEAEHLVIEFVPEALRRLEEVAALIP